MIVTGPATVASWWLVQLHLSMTHVVAEPCIACRHTKCVAVCPVDAFREGPNFLVIDPISCIDCGLCVRECPVSAIYDELELPVRWKEYQELNARLALVWPKILNQREELPTAANYRDIHEKRTLLIE